MKVKNRKKKSCVLTEGQPLPVSLHEAPEHVHLRYSHCTDTFLVERLLMKDTVKSPGSNKRARH